MKATFDLVESPWVPCIRGDGTTVEVGLRDALVKAHELRELHGESPLVTAALHRLLLAMLHRVFGPASRREWADLWQGGRWPEQGVETYLGRWRQRFDLFHPTRPFYQAPGETVDPWSLAGLVYEVASGDNPTLFDHHTRDDGISVTPARAARLLVAAQAFGLGGARNPKLKLYFTDAPCARGVVFLVQGDSLFETLALNLLRYPDDAVMGHQSDDRPAWEMDDPFAPPRSVPLGYLDYLTWQNRRILFTPPAASNRPLVTETRVAPGLRLEEGVLDPMKHYRQDKNRGPLMTRFREHRALWRDSAALFQLGQAEYIPPRAFDWLASLVYRGYLDKSETRRYLALGMAADQARVDFYRSERMPLPLAYLRDQELVEYLEQAVDMAERAGRQLWGATRTLAALLLSPESDSGGGRQPAREDLHCMTSQWAADRRYWSRLEIPFLETLESLPDEPDQSLERWRSTLRRTARGAFDELADNLGPTPRAFKAVVRASGQLAAGLAKALPSE
jgi:CRISPR system Cascade subunit CasA